VPVDLGTELQRLTRCVNTGRSRVQNGAAVAQAGNAGAIQQVGVDAGDLRGAVGADAKRSATELVDELEGLEIQFSAGAGEQRFDVFEQRRHHELTAVSRRNIEQTATQLLDVSRLRRQNIGYVLRQQPGRGHAERGDFKNEIVRGSTARYGARPGRRPDSG